MILNDAIVCLLEVGMSVDKVADLCCYPCSDGTFAVEYFLQQEFNKLLGLTDEQEEMLQEEGEFVEYFVTAQEACEFFMLLWNQIGINYNVKKKKPNLKEKLVEKERNKYFE